MISRETATCSGSMDEGDVLPEHLLGGVSAELGEVAVDVSEVASESAITLPKKALSDRLEHPAPAAGAAASPTATSSLGGRF